MSKEKRLLERFDSFMKGLKREDRIAIIHDTDPDGLCGAVILAKLVERLRGKKIELRLNLDKKEYTITQKMFQKLRLARATKIIMIDFSADQNPSIVKRLENFASNLIIDHHKLYNDVNSAKTILVKPQLFTAMKEPAHYCSAKLAYDLSNRLLDMSDLDWLAAVASIADIATTPWKDWLASVFKKYKVKPSKDLFKTKFGELASLISSAEVYSPKNVAECFKTFYNATKPEDALSSRLKKFKQAIEKEINFWTSIFKQKVEKYNDLYWFEIRPKYNIHSPMATMLGQRYPHKTIIVANIKKGFVAVSARRSDKAIAVNELLEKATAGFKGASAGGHTAAAGAGFDKKYYSTFKKRVLKVLSNAGAHPTSA